MLKKGKPYFTKVSKGKLIVFEGIDGSGKTTQAKLLLRYLRKNKISSACISFPRYQDSLWGNMVRRYLDGEFGDLDRVSPYLASVLYAGDRLSAANSVKKWLGKGKIVVCNRYVGSNLAHMGGKLKGKSEKAKYVNWLEKLEYQENGIPKEDLAILLSTPAEFSRKLMSARKLDIHERNIQYQSVVAGIFEQLAREKENWFKVDCVRGVKLRKPQDIHKEVLEILRARKIINR